MMNDCVKCGKADLRPAKISLSGEVRGETFTVQMDGLVCPECKYQTIEGAAMPEFGRLLADQYRAAHGLLTSVQIRDRRGELEMSQQQFADFLGVGIASVKRWEMGKIQDRRSNDLILERTAHSVLRPAAAAAHAFQVHMTQSTVSVASGGIYMFIGSNPPPSLANVQRYLQSAPAAKCRYCASTIEQDVIVNTEQTGSVEQAAPWIAVPAFVADLHAQRQRKDRHGRR